MKNTFRPELWRPVIPEHPHPSTTYRRSKPHVFTKYQPLSERYQVPGLLPSSTRKKNDDPKPY